MPVWTDIASFSFITSIALIFPVRSIEKPALWFLIPVDYSSLANLLTSKVSLFKKNFLVVSNSSKKRRNKWGFSTVRQKKTELISSFFGRIISLKETLWLCLTFSGPNKHVILLFSQKNKKQNNWPRCVFHLVRFEAAASLLFYQFFKDKTTRVSIMMIKMRNILALILSPKGLSINYVVSNLEFLTPSPVVVFFIK